MMGDNAMTEETAKRCWCPFARTFESDHSGENGQYAAAGVNRPAAGALCIASRCMAWRTLDEDVEQGVPLADLLLRAARRRPGPTSQGARASLRGYCGLAGAP